MKSVRNFPMQQKAGMERGTASNPRHKSDQLGGPVLKTLAIESGSQGFEPHLSCLPLFQQATGQSTQ